MLVAGTAGLPLVAIGTAGLLLVVVGTAGLLLVVVGTAGLLLVVVGTVDATGLSGLALQHGEGPAITPVRQHSTSAATLIAQRGHNAVMCAV